MVRIQKPVLMDKISILSTPFFLVLLTSVLSLVRIAGDLSAAQVLFLIDCCQGKFIGDQTFQIYGTCKNAVERHVLCYPKWCK